MSQDRDILERIEQLNSIGISLSAEKDSDRLLEHILIGAKSITNADGGTVYLMEKGTHLRFAIMRTDSLDIALGGTTGRPVMLDPIPLYDGIGRPNIKTVAACAAITGATVNIADAYASEGFDFAGTKSYDRQMGYRSSSFLTIPMRDHENVIIGVLQLINARDPATGGFIPFSDSAQRLAESLASQAAVALTNQSLVGELRRLLEKFIEVIADAIDEKSPYTGGHCRRVPELAMMIAEAVNDIDAGPFAEFQFNEAQLYELHIAALLHDCGKITTPVHIVDKATKLETIFDRIHLVEARLEILRRDAEIDYLRRAQALQGNAVALAAARREYERTLESLAEDREFLRHANIGSEFMPEEARARVKAIAKRAWSTLDGERRPLLSEDEVENLTIPKGTLTPQERTIINNHIVTTIRMLEQLPFPRYLRNVAEIAGGHHERMDGKGYPKGLTREEMSVQARLLGIVDIFEALTAADRPYKKPMAISRALEIMGKMKQNNHIDPDLFDVFIHQGVYRRYAERFLTAEQLDEFDTGQLPGYRKLSGT